MIDAAGYAKSEKYRAQFTFDPAGRDNPLIVQFCGNNAESLVAAGTLFGEHRPFTRSYIMWHAW
jgi:hypothetical protein